LDIQVEKETDANVSTFTSSYPEAYKKYLGAMEKFEKELYGDAIKGFEEAIEIDTTFALPYMRIGMANVFEGRPQEGRQWFVRAEKYRDRLPTWESQLLDIYTDLWVDPKFDDAFLKMELLVENHPEDKESRFIYALLIHTFTRDTVKTLAQLDTSLQLDPRFLFSLTNYVQVYRQYGAYDKALEYARRAKEFHPDSPTPYIQLGGIYTNMDNFELAINEYEELLSRFPDNYDALFNLSNIYVHLRDFARARQCLDDIQKYHSDDPYIMSRYFSRLANLSNWAGKFRTAMDYRFGSVEEALVTNDSVVITARYATMSSFYKRLGNIDSALHFNQKAHEWANSFQRLDYYITIAELSPSDADTLRPVFDDALIDIRGRLPSEFLPLIDAVKEMYEAHIKADTASLIRVCETIYQQNPRGNESTDRTVGYLSILSGQFKKGRDILTKYIEGERRTNSGFQHPYIHYHLGLAEECLGNTQNAIEHYQEMLKFWVKPEIELKEIKDARERLARLTS
jgi:tetratricopeptide (TPR) repeat protein